MKKEKTRINLETEFSSQLAAAKVVPDNVLAALINNGDSLVLADKAGSIIYVNSTWEKMTGYGASEVIGKSLLADDFGLQTLAFYTSAWETISAGRIFRGDFLNHKKDGVLYYQSATIIPILNKSGQIALFLSLSQDMTKQYYREKKLALVGRIAIPFFKQLRTPLALVQAAAFRLRSFARGEKKLSVYRDLEKIYETGQEMSVVLDTLSNFLDDETAPQLVSLLDLIANVNQRLDKEFHAAKVAVSVSAETGLPLVSIDQTAWEFALAELGRLAIAAINSKKDRRLVISLKAEGNDLIFSLEHAASQSLSTIGTETASGLLSDPKSKLLLIEKIIYDDHGLIQFSSQSDGRATTTIVLPTISGSKVR